MRVWLYRIFCSVVTIAGVWGVGHGMTVLAQTLDAQNSRSGFIIYALFGAVSLALIIALGWIVDVRAGPGPGRGRTGR